MRISLRTRLLLLLLAIPAVIAPALVTGGARPAQAEGRTVTLSQSTNLAKSQVITVTWTGFRPGPAYLQMCIAGSTTWATCSEVTRVEGTTDAEGNGSSEFTIWRKNDGLPTPPNVLNGSNNSIPCGGNNPCELVVSECGFALGPDVSAAAPLAFGPNTGANPVPTLLPEPTTTTTIREPLDSLPEGEALVGASSSSAFRMIDDLQFEGFREPVAVKTDIIKLNSPAALQNFADGNSDFVITSLPLSQEQMDAVKADGRKFAYVPIGVSALSVAYELRISGIRVRDINLNAEVIADMYLGRITDWKDPRVVEANRGCAIQSPNNRRDVITSFRTDASGANYLFSSWLTAEADDGAEAKWGLGAGLNLPIQDSKVYGFTGAEELSRFIAKSDGTDFTAGTRRGRIGFVDRTYARMWDLPSASLENESGAYVSADDDAAVLKAIELADPQFGEVYAPDFAVADEGTYPLPVVYYALVQTNPTDSFSAENVEDMKKWLTFAISDERQAAAQELGFVPLPDALEQQAVEGIAFVGTEDEAPVVTTTTTTPPDTSTGGFGPGGGNSSSSPTGSSETGGGSTSTKASSASAGAAGGDEVAIENASVTAEDDGVAGAIGSILGTATGVLALPLLLALGLGGVVAGQLVKRSSRKDANP